MEKITQFFTNYRSFYNIFKKLPVIIFFVFLFLGVVLGFVDVIAPFTELGYDAPFASIILFPLLCAVVGAINSIVYAIVLSPVVIITDASLKKLDEEK